jgi:hypothetical protein
MQQCQERSGFLFAHACDQPSTALCSECGKPVCNQHTRVTVQGDCCISCAKKVVAAEETRGEGVRSERWDSDPYWYAERSLVGYHYYDDRDRRAFDRRERVSDRDGFEDDFDGS